MSVRVVQWALSGLDRMAARLPWNRRRQEPAHLQMGRRGEEAAYFWLRRNGFTVVARNWRPAHGPGELDLVAWERGVLCFIEVKTRARRTFVPAEAAVDLEKQHTLRAAAQQFWLRAGGGAAFRFDVVSVYAEPGAAAEIRLIRNVFRAEWAGAMRPSPGAYSV
jgi:putative endonuclease